MARVLIEFDDGKKISVSMPDEEARKLLVAVPGKNEILNDLMNVLNLENVRFTKKYKLNDFVFTHLRVLSSKVRLSLEVCGDFYTVYNSRKDAVDLEELKNIVDRLTNDTERFVFETVTFENTDVRLFGVYPAKYVDVIPNFIEPVNSRYAVGRPEFTPDEVIGLALSNAHLLVGVYREEIPDVPSGVLGSLVRKGQLLTDKELRLYLPNPRREDVFLSKKEAEALGLVAGMTDERIGKLEEIYGERLTLEEVSWKLL